MRNTIPDRRWCLTKSSVVVVNVLSQSLSLSLSIAVVMQQQMQPEEPIRCNKFRYR